ncbi:MAG: regulatory protein RecX [Jiangellaceae bacterium]|nr:regulatory protein RecX [Jiangellaceae bacterium]
MPRPPREPPARADDDPEPDPESVARTIALRRLAAAPQTRAQLDEAMRRRGVPDDVRKRVLTRFTEVGLVDDVLFAQAWVHSRHAGRGLAGRALAAELHRRGVERAVVEDALADLPPEAEEATARRLVATKLSATHGLDPAARLRRLVGLLARKGYPSGMAYRVVRDVLADDTAVDDVLTEVEAAP